jgi:hypothetical protein
MGHAALNYDQGDIEEQMARYSEELRASPPRRTRVILLKQQDSKAVTSLFQAMAKEGIAVGAGLARPRWVAEQERKEKVAGNGELAGGKRDVDVLLDGKDAPEGGLETGNRNDQGSDLQEEKVGNETSKPRAALEAKERVSFGTNMTSDGESSEGNLVVKMELELATAVERFHARKFGANPGKRGVLKVNSAGTSKK